MSGPLTDASKLPPNELLLEGEATKDEQSVELRLQRETDKRTIGVTAGISKQKGWFAGFSWLRRFGR